MIGWLWRVIIGRFGACRHEWSIFDSIRVYSGERRANERPVATRYVLQCKACGDLRKREIGS